MANDKIIYTKELGKNMINVVFSQVSKMLHIVVATQVKSGGFVGKSVGKPFTLEQESEAIKVVDTICEKWNVVYNEQRMNAVKADLTNIKDIASTASKTLCLN